MIASHSLHWARIAWYMGGGKCERNSMSLIMRFYWAIALAALLAAYFPSRPF